MSQKHKIIITDCPFPNKKPIYETLGALDADITLLKSVDEETLVRNCKDADAIIVAYADINKRVIDAMEKCKIIARLGIGMNNIDLNEATAKGIFATNVREPQSTDVANHAIVLMLALAKKILLLDRHVKNGNWSFDIAVPIYKLSGKVLGLCGFGNIGKKVASRAKAFEMEVISYDPYISQEIFSSYGVKKVTFEELLKESDFISLHMPLTDATKNQFSEEQFSAMKETAYLINTSRGGLIDEEALVEALKNKKIAGAGLDVLASEFPGPKHPLYDFDNVIITPHSAYYSEECIRDLEINAAQEVVRVLAGEKPVSLVNTEVLNR